MELKIIYEDNNILVVDKPAGIAVFSESPEKETAIIDLFLEKYPDLKNAGQLPRYGTVHRLDKDTSGILLIAKNNDALTFLQKQFKNKEVEKKYLALATGTLEKENGIIETLIGRSPQDRTKQKVYLANEPGAENKRKAITLYKVLKIFENYSLIEAIPRTGRLHQIRCHLAYLHHPIAGDKKYGFKDSPCPKGLTRQFLHATYLKIKLPNGETKEFQSDLPEDLKKILENLTIAQK